MGLLIVARIADLAQPLQRRTLRFHVEPGEGTLARRTGAGASFCSAFATSGGAIGISAASYSARVSDNVPMPGNGIKTRSCVLHQFVSE